MADTNDSTRGCLVKRGRKSIMALCDADSWSTIRRWRKLWAFPLRSGPGGRPFVFVKEVEGWYVKNSDGIKKKSSPEKIDKKPSRKRIKTSKALIVNNLEPSGYLDYPYKCKNSEGYIQLTKDPHVGKGFFDCVLEHRYALECKLGRKLERHEVVHHKDLNKENNSLDNLELLSWSNHSSMHAIERATKIKSSPAEVKKGD